MAIEAFAPAKINLTLHVTGRRQDGYHLLDSLVAFANVGDRVRVEPSDDLSLHVDGPEARDLTAGDDNLVLRAARFLRPDAAARITLTKVLPVASGIGGGSADAAATLRALAQLWTVRLPDPETVACLGADVPACLAGYPLRLRGIGDDITPAPGLPPLDILLVNPRRGVSTPDVFRRLTQKANPPMPDVLPAWPDQYAFCDWLKTMRNDLQSPAQALCPDITEALALIGQTDCLYAGMSGSGATCFGLYLPDGHSAKAARAHLQAERPGWWCANGKIS